jgi:type 1 fimbriae regulatory protein FimB
MKRRTESYQFLTEDEIGRLLGVISSPRDRAIFTVAFWRGLRASEIGLLTLADLNLKQGRLYVHRLKGSHSGEYLLSDEELRSLRVWQRVRGTDPGPLFASRNRRPISRYMLHRLMRRYSALAGIDPQKAHMHVLKHTCGTFLMGRPGAEVRMVQDWLGHSQIQNTVKYTHVRSPERERFQRRIYGRG